MGESVLIYMVVSDNWVKPRSCNKFQGYYLVDFAGSKTVARESAYCRTGRNDSFCLGSISKGTAIQI